MCKLHFTVVAARGEASFNLKILGLVQWFQTFGSGLCKWSEQICGVMK